MKKMTKREKFEALLTIPAVAENEMLTEFIQNELNLLAKKNSGEKKPTANQTVNEGIKANIVATMEPNRLYSITELLKVVPDLPDTMTNQRMTAIVRQLKDDGIVIRVEEKRKAYFVLAEGYEGEVEGE